MSESISLTYPMIVVLGLLLLTVVLFVSEVVRVDVAAIIVMVLLGLCSLTPGLEDLVSRSDLFSGFSSNAVISIIAVMIIGAGLDRTGITGKLATIILRHGGSTEKRLVPLISATVGFISSFMQNVGAAALFLPVVSRISARSGVPLSRMLMPMGFCAILGGTVTMVGSSPLILLNDLLITANRSLPDAQKMATFGLFDVSPIGIVLIVVGILYFMAFGRLVLPRQEQKPTGAAPRNTLSYFRDAYGMDLTLCEVKVPAESSLVGTTLNDFEARYHVRVIAMREGQTLRIGAGSLHRDIAIAAYDSLAVVGCDEALRRFIYDFGLTRHEGFDAFEESLSPAKAGIAEVVIPPRSALIGETALSSWMRKCYGLAMLAIHRGGETLEDDVANLPFAPGDTLMVHTQWENLARQEQNRDFVIVTTEYPHEDLRPQKLSQAVVFFLIALGLVLFSDLQLSVALLTGAVGMIVSGVLSMDEAYEAVSWKTVFLLASLIPLGLAVQTSGTAAWIAQQTLSLLGDVSAVVIQAMIAVLATLFTLVMSNVGATVLLVPLAVNFAIGVGSDPAIFALTVAIATSNSFLIPTHQVNALIMGPGGYRVIDFLRAGGIMTVLFLVVSLLVMNLVF